jgi:Family of unknown function (DUF5675)
MTKLIAHLYRQEESPDGTFGRLVFSPTLQFITGELPWRDNKSRSSCIPKGTYIAKSYVSPKFGKCYIIGETAPRSAILIHPANYCGLAEEGKKQELNGCIALGLGIAKVGNQKILTSSRAAILKFQQALNGEDFTLIIS